MNVISLEFYILDTELKWFALPTAILSMILLYWENLKLQTENDKMGCN